MSDETQPIQPPLQLIISLERLRQLTGIYDSMDDDFLAPHVEVATDIMVEQILGTNLTNKLIELFNSGGVTDEPYATIYPFVEKATIFLAYKFMIPELWIQVGNGKISKGNTIDSQPVDAPDIAILKRNQQAKIDAYTKQLKRLLCKMKGDIPELREPALVPPYLYPKTEDYKGGAQGLASTPNIRFNYRDA